LGRRFEASLIAVSSSGGRANVLYAESLVALLLYKQKGKEDELQQHDQGKGNNE
jgi:hypothetical protein